MYFTECARLAEQHPDLAGTIQRINAQLMTMNAPAVIRAGDMASFLGADPNQVGSALGMLAREGLLQAGNGIECGYCGMVTLRSEYEAVMEEDGEYACTSCDRLLTEETVAGITTYRRGVKWKQPPKAGSGPGGAGLISGDSVGVISDASMDLEGWYTPSTLAERFNVGKEALRKRLDRYRENNDAGWQEREGRRPREAQYQYRLREVKPIIDDLRASGQRPAK